MPAYQYFGLLTTYRELPVLITGFYYDVLNLSVNLHSSIYCCSYFNRYDEAFQMQKMNFTIEEIKPLYKRLIPLI